MFNFPQYIHHPRSLFVSKSCSVISAENRPRWSWQFPRIRSKTPLLLSCIQINQDQEGVLVGNVKKRVWNICTRFVTILVDITASPQELPVDTRDASFFDRSCFQTWETPFGELWMLGATWFIPRIYKFYAVKCWWNWNKAFTLVEW